MRARIGGSAARRVLAVAAVALLPSACATIERGTLDDIPVITDPPGASVASSTGTVCTSPCAVTGARKEDIAVTITKAGYAAQTIVSVSKPASTLAAAQAATLTSDALGRYLDVQDGAHFKHEPASIIVKLDPAP